MSSYNIIELSEDWTHIDCFDSVDNAKEWLVQVNSYSNSVQKQLGLMGLPFQTDKKNKTVLIKSRFINGWVKIGPVTLNIIPKYIQDELHQDAGKTLAKLLEYSKSSRFKFYDWVQAGKEHLDPIDFFAAAFLRELDIGIPQGLPRSYQSYQSRQNSIKGKILVNQLYPNILISPHLIPQEISELTPDISLNQVLKWACSTLSNLVNDRTIKNHFLELLSHFHGVSDTIPPLHLVSNLRLPPSHMHFNKAFELAKILLEGKLLIHGAGSYETPGFLFNSWHIFQEYTGKLLHEAIDQLDMPIKLSRKKHLLGSIEQLFGNQLNCDPDFVLEYENRPIAALDAKYKKVYTHRYSPDEANIYQVIAAAKVIKSKRAVLIVPFDKTKEIPSHPGWDIKGEAYPTKLELVFLRPSTLWDVNEHKLEVERLSRILANWIITN